MSLFKTKEIWTQSNHTEENFSVKSLAFFPSTDLISNSPYTDLIVTTSLSGVLRLYNVSPNFSNEDVEQQTDAAPNSLLLETSLEMPILQIDVGKFSSGGKGPQVALLHPRLLAVYAITRSNSKEKTTLESYQMNLVYQHKLTRSAYSMCTGPFGGVQGKDYMCVQSLDGTLNLFENESFSFSRFLPGFLIPGPLAYVAKTDSFVTVSSSFQLESYKYQTLATATDDAKQDNDTMAMSGKRIVADWVLGLGEHAFEIQVIPSSSSKDSPCKIVVLGVKSIFVLHHSGVLAYSKKLDFNPVTMLTYTSLINSDRLISLISTDTNTMLIFEITSLKWAAQLPFTPLIIKRGTFSNGEDVIRDALVIMSKTGDIYVGVLGTEPSLFSAPRPEARQVNYEETDIEMASLNTIIKTAQTADEDGGAVTSNANVREELTLKVDFSPHIETCFYNTMVTDDDNLPMTRISVSLSSSSPLTKVRVGIDVMEPLVVTKTSFIVNSLTDKYSTEVSCYLYYPVIPQNMDLTVTAAYISGQGVPVVMTNVTSLPIKLIVKPCAPIKDADYKVTLSTNKPAVSLLDLFPEFVLDSTMANAAGFQYFGGPYVTVLSSKTSQRYRLQSDNLASLWLLTQSLESRLTKKFSGDNNNVPLECSYSSSLPMHEYYSEIEMHFHKRKKLITLQEQLGQRAAQFRSIQKRLLARFKDKTPTPLTNLDTLLEGTCRQLHQSIEAVDQCLLELKRSSNNLSCITSLLVFLVRLSSGLSEDEVNKVKAALTPSVHEFQEQGWEETTDAALTFLLRTSLAKVGKENQGATPITLDVAKDTSRIKKHVSSVIDRITKGNRIQDDKNRIEAPSPMEFNTEEDEIGQALNDVHSTPIGSHFGEAGQRLRSARTRGNSAVLKNSTHQKITDSQMTTPMNNTSSDNLKMTNNNKEPASELTEEEKEVEKHIINDDGPNGILNEADVDIW